MLKKFAVLAMGAALAVSISACGKQEQPPAGQQQPSASPNLALPQKGQEATVTLPPDVKGKWKAIKVSVTDKKTQATKELTVKLGEEQKIPGSKLSIKAVEFLPSFVMQGLNITSASNEPANPAAQVIITEDGKEIFKGWLFLKFPTTHAFQHPEYSVVLTGGVPA